MVCGRLNTHLIKSTGLLTFSDEFIKMTYFWHSLLPTELIIGPIAVETTGRPEYLHIKQCEWKKSEPHPKYTDEGSNNKHYTNQGRCTRQIYNVDNGIIAAVKWRLFNYIDRLWCVK